MKQEIIESIERKMSRANGEYSGNLRDRPYDGQPWTDQGIRGKTEINGITFRDLTDCICAAILTCSMQPELQRLVPDCESSEIGEWTRGDVYSVDTGVIDPLALAQTVACLVEKYMGIFPNCGTLIADPVQYLEDNNYVVDYSLEDAE